MSRGKTATALAVTDIPNLPAPGSTITPKVAVQIARQVGAKLFRDAKDAQRAKREEVAQGVGGQIARVDETVVEQGQRFMARLALISQSQKSGRGHGGGGSSSLDPIIKQMGAIVGALQAMMLTDRSIGLFEDIREYDYEGYPHMRDEDKPWTAVGDKAKAAAKDVLSQYTIAEPEAKPKRGGKGAKNVTPEPEDDEHLDGTDPADLDEAVDEGIDQEADDL